MARLEVDKERFKQFLDQFIGDAPYQIELVKKILSQMPIQVTNQLIEELYYDQVYQGPVYIAQHAVFKDDVRYFANLDSLTAFLNDINKHTNEFNPDSLLTIDVKFIQKRMRDNLPLCGYLITMERLEKEDGKRTRKYISKFE